MREKNVLERLLPGEPFRWRWQSNLVYPARGIRRPGQLYAPAALGSVAVIVVYGPGINQMDSLKIPSR